MKHLQHTYETTETLDIFDCNMCFSSVLSDDVEQSRERSVPNSLRPRMVARPSSGQLRLPWARPTTVPSLGCLATHGGGRLQVEMNDAVEMEDGDAEDGRGDGGEEGGREAGWRERRTGGAA